MISVVVPFRDERDNIEPLVERLHTFLEGLGFEIICVDDGSVDGSRDILRSLSERFPRVRLLSHETSVGQSATIVSGVRAARGTWIVTLDGDGQNDPADIPTLLAARDQATSEPALVMGWRRHRRDPWIKRLSSKLANSAYKWILDDDTPDVGCGLKLFRREMFLELPHFDHMHRFLPALVRMHGGSVVSVEVHHHERRSGRSKYGIHDRLWAGLVDLLGVRWLQARTLGTHAPREQHDHESKCAGMRQDDASEPSLPHLKTPSTVHRTRSLRTILGFLFAVSLVFARLGQIPLLDPDEGRNAEIAREMVASGRWLVPTYNGVPYLDKPALYFRLVATSLTAFGHSEFAARLPSALFALALLVLVYRFCRREYGERTAVLSVVIVASMPLFLALARIVIFDMALAFFVCAAIFAGYRAEESEGAESEGATRKRWYATGAALAGVATLVKGPVGFILPVVVLLALAAVERRRGVLRRILHPWNLVIFFALVLPWFVGVSLERPDFPYYGLVRESFERFTTPTFDRTGPFYYYVPVMAGVCFGWSFLFPGAAFLAWRRRSGWTRADRLLVVWAIAVPAFFSISQSKLSGYVLTAVVALGVLLARLFGRAFENPESSSARVVRRGALFLMLGSVAALSWLTVEVLSPDTLRTYFDLRGADYERARLLFPALLAPLAVLAAASLIASLTRNVTVTFASFLLVPASLVTVSFGDVQSYALRSSSIRLAQEVQSIAPEANVVCLECYPAGLAFYLERELILVTADGTETTSNYIPFYLAHNEPWPPQIVPVSRFRQWLAARRFQAVVLARGERVRTLGRLAMRARRDVRELSNGWRALLLPARHTH